MGTFGRRHARRGVALVFTAALSASWVVRSARADDVANEAELQFTLGAERYQAGDYRGALEHFLSSNRLAPNGHVLFDIARTYEQLQKFPEAYEYYLRTRQHETAPAALDRIDESLRRVAPNVAVLHVETVPPGARVFLSRKDLGERGTSPASLGALPGRYRVIAELAGYDDATSDEVDLQKGAVTPVTLTLSRVVGTLRVEGASAGAGAGATVRVDREDAPASGTVPCDVSVPPGRHLLYVEAKGFRSATIPVEVPARGVVVVRPSLDAWTGTLRVDADERGAVVEVDGVPRGATPALVVLPVGEHHVRVAMKGFRAVTRDVRVTADEQTRVDDIALTPVEEVEAASRATESVDLAPASVTVIGNRELRAMAYPSLVEAMRGVRGVFVSDDRGYPVFGIRGFGRPGDYGNRVLVLLDGHPMNDNWIGEAYEAYDLRTDLEDIDRIEVVRGAGSVLYGTSAFTGVVNLVSRPRDEPAGHEVGMSTAEYGLFRARARTTIHFGRDAGVWTSVAGGHSAGRDFFFPEYAADTPPAVAGNARGVDGLDVATWTGRTWWKALTVQWSLNSQTKQLPTGQFDTILGDARTRQNDTRGMVEARFEPRLSPSWESLTRAHVNYYGFRASFAHDVSLGGLERQTYDGTWTGLEQRFVYAPSDRARITVGGEAQLHLEAKQYGALETSGTYLYDDRQLQVGAGYVVADVTPTARTKISAGARLDGYSTFGLSLNPRFAVIFAPYARGNVKLLFGKAFRAPSVYELYSEAGGGQVTNASLQPENMYQTEVEYTHRFSPLVSGVVSTFANYITSLIAQRPLATSTADNPVYAYVNTDSPVLTLGAEAEVRREWKEGWMLSASYSFQHSQYLRSASLGDLFGYAKNPALREVPNAPEHLASLRAGMPLLSRALLATTRVSVQGPRFNRNDTTFGPPQGKTDPAVVWDLVVSGSEARWGVRYNVGLYNLLDWRYAVPVSPEFRQTTIVQNGRTFLFNAAVSF